MKFISSLITAASGSVAGSTYSRNANGAYIRNKGVPTNPNTLSQQAARARFSTVSTGWKSLDDVQRQSFIDRVGEYPYVDALGQTKTYTGSQLYKALNGILLQNGADEITTCLPPQSLVNMGLINASADQSAVTIQFDEFEFGDATGDVPANCILTVFATTPIPWSITNVKRSSFRTIRIFADGDTVAAVNLVSDYEAVFGNGWRTAAVSVNNIWFGVRLINTQTGQSYTNIFQASCPINA